MAAGPTRDRAGTGRPDDRGDDVPAHGRRLPTVRVLPLRAGHGLHAHPTVDDGRQVERDAEHVGAVHDTARSCTARRTGPLRRHRRRRVAQRLGRRRHRRRIGSSRTTSSSDRVTRGSVCRRRRSASARSVVLSDGHVRRRPGAFRDALHASGRQLLVRHLHARPARAGARSQAGGLLGGLQPAASGRESASRSRVPAGDVPRTRSRPFALAVRRLPRRTAASASGAPALAVAAGGRRDAARRRALRTDLDVPVLVFETGDRPRGRVHQHAGNPTRTVSARGKSAGTAHYDSLRARRGLRRPGRQPRHTGDAGPRCSTRLGACPRPRRRSTAAHSIGCLQTTFSPRSTPGCAAAVRPRTLVC